MLHFALLSSIAAATDPKISTSGPDGAKHITISSGPGVSIQANGGTYEIGDRFAKLEAEAAAISTMAEETKTKQGETSAELKKFKEAINNSCPTGSMIVGHNADGTPICNAISDDEWQRKVTVPCKGSAVLQSISKDGTPVCVDPTPDEKEFQRRIASACPPGQAVQEGLVNGSVVCDAIDPAQDGSRRSVYTVWGSQDCKEQSELVYAGWMGASRYSHAGSGANYLCMAVDGGKYNRTSDKYGAEYSKNREHGGNQDGALLYMNEYRVYSSSAGLRFNYYFTDTNYNRRSGRQMACAVCEAKSPNVLEVSGRTECPVSYNKAQKGYLMGAYRYHKATGPGCIEQHPQADRWDRSKDSYGQAGSQTLGGAYLYAAELDNPPGGPGEGYIDNLEVPCLKCTANTNKHAKTFTRFGHRTCPDATKLIYSGWTAGPVESQSGHGTGRLCMPNGPQYTGAENRNSNPGMKLVRSRYRTDYSNDAVIKAQKFREVACAVCEAQSAAVITVPGAQTCPTGYDENYKGYLMTSRQDMYPSEFTCVDEALQNILSETVSNNNPLPTDPKKPNPNSMRDVGTSRSDGLYFTQVMSPPTSKVKDGVTKYTNRLEASCISCRKSDPVAKVATYTQWGSSSCPKGTKTLVSGWMANGRYNNRGGGNDYQCMSKVGANPKKTIPGDQRGGWLMRVEYKSDSTSGGLRTAYKKVEYGDAACAICEAEAEDTLMIPGKKTCPRGYSELYKGHIAGSRYNYKHKTEFICLDDSFQTIAGSNKGNQGAAWLSLAETELSSPLTRNVGYGHNMEVPCIVCAI